MYQSFFEIAFYELGKLGLQGPVDFIFDDTTKYKSLITSGFKYTYNSALELGIIVYASGAFPVFQSDKVSAPLQAADLLARLIRTTVVNGVPWDGSQMPWKKGKSIYCLNVDLNERYFPGKFDEAFSKENLDTAIDHHNSNATMMVYSQPE